MSAKSVHPPAHPPAPSAAPSAAQPSTLPHTAHAPTHTQPQSSRAPLAPMPGTREYALLQTQVMKECLDGMAEPSPGESDRQPRVYQAVEQWTRLINYGEAQIVMHGPRVDPALLRKTVQLQFFRTLVYWRMFRFSDLPPEIISNIFRLVVWSTPQPQDAVTQRLRLTWICRTWRQQAIGDATLWNAIWFRDAPPYERSLEWFKRARTARLDIRLNEIDPKWTKNEDNHKFTAEQMSDLLDILFTKIAQIRMLVVIVDNWPPALTVIQKLQAAGNAGMPINIERLEIHRMGTPYVWIGPGFDTKGHRDPAILFGGQTRALKYLLLSGIHIDWNETPLFNLTTLDLRNMAMDVAPTLSRFREILRNCPRLEKLTLDGCGPQPEEKPFLHAPVDLPHLKALVLGSFSLPYACFAVAQVNAPHVRDLTLMSLNGNDYTPLITQLTSMFKEVRILTLYGVEIEMSPLGKRTMVRWLDAMPLMGYARIAKMRLEVLKMFAEDPKNYRHPSVVNQSATSNAPPSVLCPRFRYMEVQAIPPAALVEFCRARKALNMPFQKIYLNTPWAQTLTEDHLKALRSEAMLYIAPVGSNTPEENRLLAE
ncbi:hypothetical protein HYDPIDRAFT_186700 [Hydnomerulius pinastri MD-312]|nr:hypothetical protein HYDPIDRAFT_186700 [Hydnomerulius pinastri MD-312]